MTTATAEAPKASRLKGKKPELIEPSKPKFLLSGKSGVGKTMFALEFPNVYYIDCEGGATREQYKKKLIAGGGIYMGKDEGSQDFKTVIDEVRALATTPHEYKTLVIDSFSRLYNIAAAIAEEKIGSEFGRDKKEANRPTRQLMRLLDILDLSVILICHQRDKWERRNGELVHAGTTFDGFDKLEYEMDLWLEVQKVQKIRSYVVKKSRIEAFPEGNEFPLDYEHFAQLYGEKVIEKEAKPVDMATPEQVAELNQLIQVVKIEPKTLENWKDKANVDDFDEMTKDQITKCLDYIKAKLKVAI